MMLCLAAALGLLLLAAPAARAQSVGFSVNGGCDVGACPPTTPLPIGGSEFQPFSFTVSTVDGDSYQFDGEIGELSQNGGTYLPGSRGYTITYLGNSAGGTSRGTTFTTHVFFDFTPLPNGDYALIADAGGAFSAGLGDGTSVTVSWSFDNGAVKSSTFGPFSPPNFFFQSETDTVIPPPGGPLTADVLTTIAFGAGVAGRLGHPHRLGGGQCPRRRGPARRSLGPDRQRCHRVRHHPEFRQHRAQRLPGGAAAFGANRAAAHLSDDRPGDQCADRFAEYAGCDRRQRVADLPAGFQSSEAVNVTALPLFFDCDSTVPATSIAGVNTVDLVFSTTPIADIVALAATASNDGTVHVAGGAGAFAVATVDVGAAATLTASTDTGDATLPASITLCQTAASGQCLSPPAAAVPIAFTANATPTFSIFVSSSGTIPFAPGSSRVFVRSRMRAECRTARPAWR
ncbi:MAG: hypothetical protein WDN69_32770 [Aliidongia sp.]